MLSPQLRRVAAALVALTALTASLSGRVQGQDKGKSDQEQFQGAWEVVSVEKGGAKVDDDKIKDVKLNFQGEKFTFEIGGNAVNGTFKLDPSQKPRTIDLSLGDQIVKGIYLFEGKTLKLCTSEPGQERPREFKSAEGVSLVVLRRTGGKEPAGKDKKAEEPKGAAQAERQRFQGTWVVVEGEKDGEKLPADLLRGIKLTLKGDKASVVLLGETKDATITLDPTKKPRTIDVEFEGQVIRGIYKFEKDGLRVCATEPGQDRPTEFKSAGGQFLLLFKRDVQEKEKQDREPKKQDGKESAKTDFDGEWTVVSAFKANEPLLPKDLLKQVKMTFKGNTVKLELPGGLVKEGTFKVDPSKKPATVDLTLDNETGLGIYELDGDTLKVCAVEPGKERPREFKSDGEQMLIVFKRTRTDKKEPPKGKEAPPEEAVELQPVALQPDQQTDRDRLQGTWAVQSVTESGKQVPAEEIKSFKLVFKGDRVTIHGEDKPKEGTFKLDPGKKPKEIDITLEDQKKQGLGIYKFEGETLILNIGEPPRGRPTAFTSDEVSRTTLVVLKRAATDKKKSSAARPQRLQPVAVRVAQPADMQASHNNLRQIGLALHNYHDANRRFPAAAIYDKDGKPLLSWRVAILPYIEQGALYRQFKLDEPWDSPHNKKLLEKMPRIYAPVGGAETKEPHSTYYRVFTGPGTVFEGTRGQSIVSITDGTSNTALAVEASEAVPWTKPDEIPFDAKKNLPKLGGLFREGFHLLMADGSVLWVGRNFDAATLRSVITRNDGMVIDLDKIRGAK